jgi:hypothetical protein
MLPRALSALNRRARAAWELRKSKGGKKTWTKPPKQARDPAHNARSNDSSTWGTHDDAIAAVQRGNADGIGYMLLGSGIGAVDLDHVLEDAKLVRWAEQLCVEATGTYQETTVSGAGLRIIGTAAGRRRTASSPSTARLIRRSWMIGASIETTRELWASSLREVKKRIRPLFAPLVSTRACLETRLEAPIAAGAARTSRRHCCFAGMIDLHI